MIDIFKTSISIKKLDVDTKSIQKYCLEQKKKNKGNLISNAGGWQSKNLIGEHPVLNNVFIAMEEQTLEFAKEILKPKQYFLKNAWININEYRDYNLAHTHPQCLFSSIFYAKAPIDSGNLIFHSYDAEIMGAYWHHEVLNTNIQTGNIYTVVPEESMLVIFPSFLKHEVSANMNKKECRISIASNLGKEENKND
jgi:uncharacterized protein (TIGR02466 family)|tara:strand:+ start:2691 stop:3275 length:585 start_codon:yes stop_codon:yes gene_type:complete